MPSQFVRIQSAGLVSRGKKANIAQMVGEAMRTPSRCRHVPSPMAPNIIYGQDVENTHKAIKKMVKAWEKRTGRTLPKNAQLLLGCVASYPATVEELKNDPIEYQNYLRWKRLNIAWAKEEWGDQFHAAIEHLDEPHPHLHMWAIAKEIDGKPQLGPINCGAWAERGKAPKERIPAYKKAMRAFQDRYWFAVGRVLGWLRLSADPKKRLSYRDWKIKKEVEKKLKEIQDEKQKQQSTQRARSIQLDLQVPYGPAYGLRPPKRIGHR